MRFTREHAAAALSAPLMVAGLAAAALAASWPMRLGGMAMVIGASLALSHTGVRVRILCWSLAFVGAVAVILALL